MSTDKCSQWANIAMLTGMVIFIFLFCKQNICCGYSMRRFFEHPKHMLKLMGKKIFTI